MGRAPGRPRKTQEDGAKDQNAASKAIISSLFKASKSSSHEAIDSVTPQTRSLKELTMAKQDSIHSLTPAACASSGKMMQQDQPESSAHGEEDKADAPLQKQMAAVPEEGNLIQKDVSSWAKKVNIPVKGMSLDFIPSSEKIHIFDEDFESELEYWKYTLVGSFIGSKPTLNSLKSYVEQFWNNVSKPDVLYYKKGWFYFKFANKDDCNAILHGGPWTMGNNTLILKQWTPDFHDQMESIKTVPVWILFPNLDPCFWSARALSKIASAIGKPLYADPYTTDKTRISFARILVDLDISQELKNEVAVVTPYGEKRIMVNYEWVSFYCNHCHKIGHTSQKCRKNQVPIPQKQVWVPVKKDATKMTNSGKLEMGDPSLTALQIKKLSEAIDNSLEAAIVVDDGFTIPRRRSTSPKYQSTSDSSHATPLGDNNSFQILAVEDECDDIMMEGGGTPHSSPC